MLHKLDIFSASLQAICMTSLWEMAFYDHCVMKMLGFAGNDIIVKSTLALDFKISIPIKLFS